MKKIFLAFFILFLGISFTRYHAAFDADEARYLQFANNLSHGFYSPANQIDLWNGPGYPLFLAPFVALKLPIGFLRMLNAVLFVLSLVFFYKAACKTVQEKNAKFAVCALGLYLPFMVDLPYATTEPLCIFLISVFLDQYKNQKLLGAGFALGYLALTKVLFGYVVFMALVFYGVLFLCKRTEHMKLNLLIATIAAFCTLPYLFYTYSLTERTFYWANSGGMSLYWMSTPFEAEYGDWHPENLRNYPQLIQNHGKFFEEIKNLSPLEKNDAFIHAAIQNIKAHPLKFLKNGFYNFTRLWFSFPYSYQRHKDIYLLDLVYAIPNLILLVFLGISFFIFSRKQALVNNLLSMPFFLFSTYVGLSLPLSAYGRLLTPVVPLILYLIISAYKTRQINVWNKKADLEVGATILIYAQKFNLVRVENIFLS